MYLILMVVTGNNILLNYDFPASVCMSCTAEKHGSAAPCLDPDYLDWYLILAVVYMHFKETVF